MPSNQRPLTQAILSSFYGMSLELHKRVHICYSTHPLMVKQTDCTIEICYIFCMRRCWARWVDKRKVYWWFVLMIANFHECPSVYEFWQLVSVFLDHIWAPTALVTVSTPCRAQGHTVKTTDIEKQYFKVHCIVHTDWSSIMSCSPVRVERRSPEIVKRNNHSSYWRK